jgi:hypothetical protein
MPSNSIERPKRGRAYTFPFFESNRIPMKKPPPDPKADMYLAKAKRFRQRALGFRHTLARDDLMRAHRLELEQMVTNLDGAARQLFPGGDVAPGVVARRVFPAHVMLQRAAAAGSGSNNDLHPAAR